ncbi:MAG: hypothetical protein U1F98_13045 [Verrucomicrobiota bacterium]
MAELTLLVVTNTATDTDLPASTLNYQLVNPPSGALIDTNGVITWTPTEAQGLGVYTITTIVTDDGVLALSATNSFQVTVNEINSGPGAALQTNHTVAELTPLVVTNTATDFDVPCERVVLPTREPAVRALIDANGVITWTPDRPLRGPGVYIDHDDRHR